MAQIGKDYYEDLTAEGFARMLDDFAAGQVPTPGPQNGRYACEPRSGLTSLTDYDSGKTQYNASVQLATDIGDTIKRIDGTEVPLIAPWQGKAAKSSKAVKPAAAKPAAKTNKAPKPAAQKPVDATAAAKQAASAKSTAKPQAKPQSAAAGGKKPRTMKAPRKAGADDLKMIKGVGSKMENLLNTLGFFHFDQVAKWTADEVAWVDQNLEGFKGRVSRDNWVDQAKTLAAGGQTEFASRVKKGDVY